LCTEDRAVELVLWNPVAENVLAVASQQSIKIYDVEQQTASIGIFMYLFVKNSISSSFFSFVRDGANAACI